MSDTNVKPNEIVPEDNLQPDHDAMVNGVFHTALQEQSEPVVGHLGLAPTSETIGAETLKDKEKEAEAYLSDKVSELQAFVDNMLNELDKREEKVIQDGRSAVSNIAGYVKRELARLK